MVGCVLFVISSPLDLEIFTPYQSLERVTRMSGIEIRILRLVIVGVVIGSAATAQASSLLVAGPPGYDETTNTGLKGGYFHGGPFDAGSCLNSIGMAVGTSSKYVNGTGVGGRAVRWNGTGTVASELGILSSDSNGVASVDIYAVNDAGTAVGYTAMYLDGNYVGYRAVRWDASGTAATELGTLGTASDGSTFAFAYAINNAGTTVGCAQKYDSAGNYFGLRAVRWNASGTSATQLGTLSNYGGGIRDTIAFAVNDAGMAVGISYVSGNPYSDLGSRPVRWNASGAATELGILGTDNSGKAYAYVVAMNDAGTAVGSLWKYVNGNDMGQRAVRWDASRTAATELDNLGPDNSGYTNTAACAVNDAGTVVGHSEKYVGDRFVGTRAVRWDASGTVATELGNLGTYSNGYTDSCAIAVNSAGTAVGDSVKCVNGTYVGPRAVIWLPDASVIDLNDLGVAPVTGGGTWTLYHASAITDDGFVAGDGLFDPDGTGPQASYARIWVTQVGLGGIWTKASGGTWGRGPNWSTGTPAMQVGNATFNLNSAYTVALDRNELTKVIAVNAGTVTIDFNSHTLATESGLIIANGATLKCLVGGEINGAGLSNNNGTLTNQGSLTISGIFNNLAGGVINGTGSLNNSGTLVNNGTVAQATISNSGTLSGSGTIVSNIINTGTIAPGNGPGTLNIDGNLTSTGAGV